MLFLVDLPDPIHGMSLMNQKFADYFSPSTLINTAPSFAARYFGGPIWLIAKLLITPCVLYKVMIARLFGEKVCYRALNGDKGQVIDIFYLLLLKLLGYKVFIHHHSFNYLSRYSRLFNFICKIVGPDSFHIVLGNKMKAKLSELYGVPDQYIIVVSNSVFFEPQPLDSVGSGPVHPPVVGYMANLTLEKGLGTFVDACIALRATGIDFNAKIAGPIHGEGVMTKIDEFLAIEGFFYEGAVYANEKADFLKSIDCFCFPSQYKNEAEPLVLYEAAQFGALLLVTDTGCLADVAKALGGRVITINDDITINLISELIDLISDTSLEQKEKVLEQLSKHISSNVDSLAILNKELNSYAKA